VVVAVPAVCQGRNGGRPCDDLKGQIYLGSEAFIEKHVPRKDMKEIPRARKRGQATFPLKD
jgi:hypothetical protein